MQLKPFKELVSYGKEKTLGRWSEWLAYEKEVMESMEIRGDRIH